MWNFGDGNTLVTGAGTNVTDTYTNAGSYTVILTATGSGLTNSLTNTAYIVVRVRRRWRASAGRRRTGRRRWW